MSNKQWQKQQIEKKELIKIYKENTCMNLLAFFALFANQKEFMAIITCQANHKCLLRKPEIKNVAIKHKKETITCCHWVRTNSWTFVLITRHTVYIYSVYLIADIMYSYMTVCIRTLVKFVKIKTNDKSDHTCVLLYAPYHSE